MTKINEAVNKSKETLIEVLQKNPNFFTAFGAITVLVTGLSIANGKATWWLTGLAIMAVFLVIFIFINARVLIKATIAFIATIVIANISLQFGYYLSPYSSIGLVWMTSQFFLLFLILAASYISVGYRSRWTSATFGIFVNFLTGSSLISFMPPILSLPLATIAGFFAALSYYKYAGRLMLKTATMPQNLVEERTSNNLIIQAEKEGWEIRELERSLFRKEPIKSFLVWNDSYAFLLHPVELEAKFGVSPKRKGSRLVHKGRSINPWLLLLINKVIPLWKSRNAPIMLVLLDTSNKNGPKPEAIGVAIPDTDKKIPVGIYPGKGVITHKGEKTLGFYGDLVKEYGKYCEELDEKHKKAMSLIGENENSVYLATEETEKV